MKVVYFSLIILAIQSSSLKVFGQDAAGFFDQQCAMCHTIGGGPLAGPDLKDVTKRRDKEWLEKFVLNPEAAINSGDPIARKLKEDAGGFEMPAVSGMTSKLAQELVEFLERKSGGDDGEHHRESVGRAESSVTDRPITPDDVAAGKQIFTSGRPLIQGGAACVSCHTLGTLGEVEGGRLGPDLTFIAKRLGGNRGLRAWLSAPPTPTMKAIYGQHPFTDDEVFQLASIFEPDPIPPHPEGSSFHFQFFGAGVLGLGAALALMGLAWRGRFQNVRRNLIANTRGGK